MLFDRLELVTAIVFLPSFFTSTGQKASIEPGSANLLGLMTIALAATVIGRLIGPGLAACLLGCSGRPSVARCDDADQGTDGSLVLAVSQMPA